MALISCPDCSSEVSDAAPACPKCGRPIAAPPPAARPVPQAAAPKKNKNLSGVTVLVVFGLLGWFIYGMANSDAPTPSSTYDHGANEPTAPVAPAPQQVFATTAQDIFDAYETNEVAADNAMRGKVVRVQGVIQAIDKDFTDDVVINLRTSNQFEPARMSMVAEEKATAAQVRKGQSVVIDCEAMHRIIGAPAGDKCRFVREGQ